MRRARPCSDVRRHPLSGEGSDSLLYDAESNGFRPRVIMQQADGIWSAHEPAYTSTELPGDGSVSVAAAGGHGDVAADPTQYGDR